MSVINSIIARMGLDLAPFRRGLSEANKIAEAAGADIKKSFASYLQGTLSGLGGAFAAGEIVNQVRDAIQLGSELQDMAAQVQVSTTAWQQLTFAFGQSGVTAQETSKGLKTLSEKIADARNGNSALVQSFGKLGVSWEDLNKLSTDEIISRMANGFRDMKDPAESVAVATELLGKSGFKLASALREGADAFERIKQSASILSKEDIDTLDEYGDQVDKLTQKWRVLKAQVVIGKAPEWLNLLNPFAMLPTQIRKVKEGLFGKDSGSADVPGGAGSGPLADSPAEAAKRREFEADQARQFKAVDELQEHEAAQKRQYLVEKEKAEEEQRVRELRAFEEQQEEEFKRIQELLDFEAAQRREFMALESNARKELHEAEKKRIAEEKQARLQAIKAVLQQQQQQFIADKNDPNGARERHREERRNESLGRRFIREQELRRRGGRAAQDANRGDFKDDLQRRPDFIGPQESPTQRSLRERDIRKGMRKGEGGELSRGAEEIKNGFDSSLTGEAIRWLKDNYGKAV